MTSDKDKIEKVRLFMESMRNRQRRAMNATLETGYQIYIVSVREVADSLEDILSDTAPAEKTGRCVDCGAVVFEHQERCPVCYRNEMNKPINADEEKP